MKICFIGAGNVAWHLAQKLHSEGEHIIQVFSRELSKARELSELVNAKAIHNLSDIDQSGDIYFICAGDKAIEEIAARLSFLKKAESVLIHTSGTKSTDLLSEYSKNYGVFYPLQSFSKGRKMAYKNIPVLINGSNEGTIQILTKIAGKFSSDVRVIPDKDREKMHLAAVMINNFTNYISGLTFDFCEKEGLDFSLLFPLLDETVAKMKEMSPFAAQTGPARRGDNETIERHAELLEQYPNIKSIYLQLNNQILKKYHP
ncbi:MAG: DUF2520 domain-containing protein [Saprospiraceae bacterium]|nr:DUF2520 domain-containing protein [Saprospiraceae bacterium]